MEKDIYWKILVSYLVIVGICLLIVFFAKTSIISFTVIILLLTIHSSYMAAFFVRHIDSFSDAINAISNGNFKALTQRKAESEFSRIEDAIFDLQEKLSVTINALSDSQNKLKTILSSMVEGVIAVDKDENIMILNDSAREMLGLVGEDLVGRNISERIRQPEVKEIIKMVLSEKAPRESEIIVYGPEEKILLVMGASTKGGGAVAVLHDITRQKKLERIRTEFAANVSHELKTPLTSIKAAVETLQEGAINDQAHNGEFLDKIRRNSDRLTFLIDDLLELSSLEARKSPDQLKEYRLLDIVERAVDTVSEKAEKKQVSINVVLHDTNCEVVCNEEHIVRVLINLIDNAIKYNRDRGVIDITSEEAGNFIKISVIDTGIGIEEKHLPRLFERFYTVDKARSRELGGTGLGLSIAKHIVELNGGTISVSSRPGEGSTFSFTLKKS